MAEVTGPISSPPGARHVLPKGQVCDEHPDRPAIARVQGETDSFGCEMSDLCAECLAEHKAAVANEDTSGNCDWCKLPAQKLINRRDMEGGMSGRVYRVCQGCIDRDNAYWCEQAEEFDEYAPVAPRYRF